jgi:hypothetical protein
MMLRIPVGLFSVLSLVLLLTPSELWGQGTAQISGIVSDSSAAVLPGADVTATHTETGIVRATVTNEAGAYSLPGLPVGPYRLEVMLQGFRRYERTGIVLQTNTNPVIDVVMQLGEVAEAVTVTGATTLVETRSTGVGQIMDNQRIMDLPLNGRNPVELLLTMPAVVQVPALNATSRSMQGATGGQAYAVAGSLSFGVSYVLDGAMHNNPYDNLNLPLPFPDALQEFKAETSALTAQYGMHSGAAVNAVTKSGTNVLRGNAFEFFRHHSLNATDPFAARNPDGSRKDDGLKRNQYGGTIGGPIVRDQVFFFGAYQGTNTRVVPVDNLGFVPTAAMLNGDFRAYASAACNNGVARTLPAPFSNNQINPALLSPAAVNISRELPTPDNDCGLITYGLPDQSDDGQGVAKVDVQLNAKHSLFGRYIATSYYRPPPYEASGRNLLVTRQGGRDQMAHSVTVGENWILNPTTLNSFRFAFNRTDIHRTSTDFFSAPQMGINIYSYMPNYMLLTVGAAAGANVTGFQLGGGTESESTFDTNAWQIADDVTLVRGNHQFGIGVNAAHWSSLSLANVRSPGQLTVGNIATGLVLSDFLLGRLTQFQQAAPNTLDMTQTYVGVYAQDSWRVSPQITLNYGLRWEPFLPPQLVNGAVYQYDQGRFDQKIRSGVFPNGPAGLYFPGDPGFPTQAGMPSRWDNLAPRVGLAWDPAGDGRTVVRAAYSKAFEFVNAQFHLNTSVAPPWGSEVILANPPGGLDNPFLGASQPNIFPVTFDQNAPFSLFGPFNSLNNDLESTTVHLWNIALEKQLGADWLVSAGYVGSRTLNIWETKGLNNADPTITSAVLPSGVVVNCVPGAANFQTCMTSIENQRRPLIRADPVNGQYYGRLDLLVSDGRQHYNGMVLSVSRRAARGLTLTTNYTLSKCYGSPDGSGGGTPNLGSGYNDPNNPGFDDGNCTSDRRHIFSTTAGAQMPEFDQGVLGAIASNWRVMGSFRAVSGPWLSVTPGSERALNGSGLFNQQRANQVLDDPYGDMSVDPVTRGIRFLNPAAFALPAVGTLGTMRRNSIEGVGTKNVDVTLNRVFRVSGSQAVEFRVEAFNVFNWFNGGQPNTNRSAGTFGLITTAGAPRILQFGLKYAF